jgi:hypothetical protein
MARAACMFRGPNPGAMQGSLGVVPIMRGFTEACTWSCAKFEINMPECLSLRIASKLVARASPWPSESSVSHTAQGMPDLTLHCSIAAHASKDDRCIQRSEVVLLTVCSTIPTSAPDTTKSPVPAAAFP